MLEANKCKKAQQTNLNLNLKSINTDLNNQKKINL